MANNKKKDKSETSCPRETTLYQHSQKMLEESGERLVLSSINSGFSNIEEQLFGLKLGELYVLGGAKAMGITKFIKQLALSVSDHSGVLYLPQVETLDKLTKRLLCIAGDIQQHRFNGQPLDEKLTEQITATMTSFKEKKFFMEKMQRYEEGELLHLIEEYVTRKAVQLVIIDDEEHLFRNMKVLLNSDEKYEFILNLKLLFRRLNCCGIILKKIKPAKRTQINPYRLPKIKDLQMDYDLADLADHIWFMHRLDYYGINRDGVDNKTENRFDLYDMDADDGVLSSLYFKLNHGVTSFVVVEDAEEFGLEE